MANLLVTVGIIFVILAFWKGRNQSIRDRQELEEFKKVRDELAATKKEVDSLLEHLEAVSEKVVEEITAAAEEARRSDNDKGDKQQKVSAGEYLDENLDNEADADAEDDAEDDDDDEKDEKVSSTHGQTGSSGSTGFSQAMTGIQAYAQHKKNTPRPAGTGKTILFPRKPEGSPDRPSAAKHSEPDSEVPPKHQMIYAMTKLGYPEEEIARQLNIGRGEVRLIMQLKRKGEEANG